jgi:MFS family permease
MRKELKANIWKYFLIILTNRRNFMPIVSIYFLTLPNTTAQQIGLFTGIGWLLGFLLEIPSGYVSDKIGHKKALILAKFAMLFSTLFFLYGRSLPFFILGFSTMAFGFSFTSGTVSAFFHNTLVGLKREKEYGEVSGKIKAKVSLISAGIMLALPLLTKISLTMPIKVFLIFDLVGIITAFSLYSPKMRYDAEDKEGEKIWSQLRRFKGTGFYVTSLFLGISSGLIIGLSPYREVFLTSLGLPIILIGATGALSRFVWFVVGHNLKFLKRIKIKKLLFYEIFFFSGMMIISSQLRNPYLLLISIALFMGYSNGRGPILNEYFMNNFLINKRYKATMLSIKQQISKFFQSSFVFLLGFIMVFSFRLGFLIAGISTLVLLLAVYPFVKKSLK